MKFFVFSSIQTTNGGGRLIRYPRSFQDGRSGILRAIPPRTLRRRVLAREFRLSPGVLEGRFLRRDYAISAWRLTVSNFPVIQCRGDHHRRA